MLELKATARKWGSSIGVSLPKDIVEKANIKPDQIIKLFIQDKKVDLSNAFGTLNIKMQTQKILDQIRRGEV